MDGTPEHPYRWVSVEEIDGLTARLSESRKWNLALAIIAACALLYSVAANYQWKKTDSFAKRSFAIGYLAAETDIVTGQFSTPSAAQVNAGIMKWQATSKELGYPNPDTLRHYKLKPWEDYTRDSPTGDPPKRSSK
jgi:hypothetical protein